MVRVGYSKRRRYLGGAGGISTTGGILHHYDEQHICPSLMTLTLPLLAGWAFHNAARTVYA